MNLRLSVFASPQLISFVFLIPFLSLFSSFLFFCCFPHSFPFVVLLPFFPFSLLPTVDQFNQNLCRDTGAVNTGATIASGIILKI